MLLTMDARLTVWKDVGLQTHTHEQWISNMLYLSSSLTTLDTRTDDCGRFQFKQIFPALYPDRPIPHVHYRISSPDSEVLLVTQLYFEGAITQGYNPDQTKIASIVNEEDGSRSASFDIYVDVPGTADVNLAACDEESTAGMFTTGLCRIIPFVCRFFWESPLG